VSSPYLYVSSAVKLTSNKSSAGVPWWGDKPDVWDSFLIAGFRLPGIAKVTGSGFKQRCDRKKTAGQNASRLTLLGEEGAEFDVVLAMWTSDHLATFENLVPVLKPRYPKPQPPAATAADYAGRGYGGLSFLAPSGQRVGFLTTTPAAVPGKLTTGYQQQDKFVGFGALGQKSKTADAGGPKPLDVHHPKLKLFGIKSAYCLEAGLPEEASNGTYTVKLRMLEFRGSRRGAGVVTPNKSTDFRNGLNPGAFDVAQNRAKPSDDTGPYAGHGASASY